MNFLELFNRKSLIAAHRGARLIAPENTLSAIKASIGHCDFIEIDVQLSSDGIPVVIHDKTLERTTNVKEIYKNRTPYNVSDFTLVELNILDFGEGEKLLTLKVALEFIKENSLYLNIEIKDVRYDFNDEQIVSIVLQEIKDAGVESQVLISSFKGEYLSLVKRMYPGIVTAFLVDTHHHDNLIKHLNNLGVNAYHINKKLVSQKLVNSLKTVGIYVGVYVVNDKKEQEKLFNMGVTTIFTDL